LCTEDAGADLIEVSERCQSIYVAKDSLLLLTLLAQPTADAAIFVHGLVGKLHAGDHTDSSTALDSVFNLVSHPRAQVELLMWLSLRR
jgi:hypothetical protein